MPHIKVNVNKIRNYSTDLNSVRSKLSRIERDFSSLATNLDWDVKSASNIRNRTNKIVAELDAEASSLSKMSKFLNTASSKYAQLDGDNREDLERIELTEDESMAVIEKVAVDAGVSPTKVIEDLKSGGETAKGWLDKLGKAVDRVNKGARGITGATNLLFTMKGGKVILSGFTRSGKLNDLVKKYNNFTGIGTRYNPGTLKNVPILGGLYKLDRIADGIDKATTVLDAGFRVLDGAGKVVNIWNDDTKSTQKKVCDTAAVGITTAAGIALNVAAPYAGKATSTAVAALIPVPGLNVVAGIVAGAAVEGIMGIAADVVTSEAVVNQVSSSIENVGSAVESGVKAVSDAGKALLESKNAGEAVVNTAKLVGTAVVAHTKVVATAVAETAKVAVTVVAETAKAVANTVVDTGKKVVNWFKSW